MNGQMSINSDRVAAAINQIDVLIADIDARNNKFLTLLDEKNQQTSGKFQLIASLRDRISDAANNIKGTVQACESIKDSLRQYEALAEEANDDSAFRA